MARREKSTASTNATTAIPNKLFRITSERAIGSALFYLVTLAAVQFAPHVTKHDSPVPHAFFTLSFFHIVDKLFVRYFAPVALSIVFSIVTRADERTPVTGRNIAFTA
jgi:hypothetical protein